MAADFSLIINHPDKDEIIDKILNGSPSDDVSQWLKLKYKNKKEYQLTIKLLEDFKKSFLDLHQQQVLIDLATQEKEDKVHSELADVVINNKTYKQICAEYAETELDLKKRIKSILDVIEHKTAELFDHLSNNGNLDDKKEWRLIKLFEILLNAAEKAHKIYNDNNQTNVINNNITIQNIEIQTNAFQNAIKNVLAKISPELGLEVMKELSIEMEKLKPIQQQILSQNKREKQVQLLESKLNIEDE